MRGIRKRWPTYREIKGHPPLNELNQLCVGILDVAGVRVPRVEGTTEITTIHHFTLRLFGAVVTTPHSGITRFSGTEWVARWVPKQVTGNPVFE
jgi:hypothetical protein